MEKLLERTFRKSRDVRMLRNNSVIVLFPQSSGYIFGAHTKRRPLTLGDRVLALSDPALYVYLPGWITGANDRRLVIKFCNGKSSSHVDPQQCFWLSRDYYDRMVENYKKKKDQAKER
ncbi:uncharacterized protein LOC110065355 [Orbicella faveolata]|uniref:uncharacterized protein LOC110065355 n=1 Tax=Orbicella faveolata TaxID=48498 RepID=UPI0009E63354|nr:uncharacterized protein LOC110065355 [Orbicella faveolata]